jgi:integrase
MSSRNLTRTAHSGVYVTEAGTYKWRTRLYGSGTCATLEEARAAKRKAEERGRVGKAGRAEFGAFATDWIDGFSGRTRRGFSESSRQRYREALDLYAIPFFDGVRKRRPAAIRRADAKAFVVWLEQHEAGLSTATIERTLAPVSIMFNDAIADGVLPGANPFKDVRPNPRVEAIDLDGDDNDRRAFTRDELRSVLAAAGDAEDVLVTLVESGLRWGEFAELRGRDLKSGARGPYLAVRRAWDAKTRQVGRPKNGKPRDVPIAPDLARRLIRLQRAPDELLFQAPEGGRLNYQNTLRRVLRPILKAASSPVDGEPRPDVTWAAFHTFRHTFASLLFAEGVNVKRVSRLLGHHKASFTLDYYTHLIDDGEDAAVSVVALLGDNAGDNGAPENAGNGESAEVAKSADLRPKSETAGSARNR